VLGAPFFVMELVEGTTYRRATELAQLGPARTGALADELVDGLVALHSIEPAAVGLAGFGRPEGFLGRQVRRWRQQLDASYTRDLPAADELHRRLAARVEHVEAREPESAIVHGDYRLDNVLAAHDGTADRITAILDWEMATLGSRLTDLAMLLTYQRAAESVVDGTISDVSRAPGWPSEQQIAERYAGGSGLGLEDLDFYLGLAGLKLAAIIEGIYFRYLSGQTVGEGFATTGDNIHVVLDAGLASLAP
jgi:aminoglycoside phosphotransferase (APT) family kinase protein